MLFAWQCRRRTWIRQLLLSPQHVLTVNPNLTTMPPYPMSRPPNIIGTAYVITSATRIVWPIANLHRDGAWVAIAGIAVPVAGTISRVTCAVAVAGPVGRVCAIV